MNINVCTQSSVLNNLYSIVVKVPLLAKEKLESDSATQKNPENTFYSKPKIFRTADIFVVKVTYLVQKTQIGKKHARFTDYGFSDSVLGSDSLILDLRKSKKIVRIGGMCDESQRYDLANCIVITLLVN